jgi:type IV secretory pathway TraG/TraD family ATPase VirD4
MSTRIATAEWADPALVEDRYLYRDGDVWLGRSPSDRQLPIGYHDDRHVCLVSGSRAGKGTSSIINNLCLWPGSVVVVDPKGENATVTASRRGKGSADCEGLGQSVHVLDPFNAAQVDESYRSRFNPLDAMDPANEETIDEAGRIADAIVVIHESNDPFWDESARAMVKGLLLHVLTAPEYEGRRNLITLRKLVTRGDWEAVEALRESGETDIPPAQGLLWTSVAKNPAFGGIVAGIGDSFTNMLLNSPKQFESVLQVANRNTEFIDSPAMQRCLQASDFDLAGLKTSREGMSLYLSLPQRFMSTHYRWLRMMISLTVSEMEIVRGRPAAGFPVLMVLDEFAGLKRMEVVEHAVAQIAGYGVKLFFVLQSLEQLKAVYKDNWETFLSNSGLKIFFSLDDHFSREYVSKLVGETEVIKELHSESESESQTVGLARSLSSTLGTSQSRSRSRGQSGGTSESKSRSWGDSSGKSWRWGGSMGLLHKDEGASRGQNRSRSWTKGSQRGWSDSVTDGTSSSETHGTSESESRSFGRSLTQGTSESVHRRALIHPDEIGHVFARVDDREEPTYPGLELVIISGQRPMPLRRVHYYEDLEFIGRFEPAPDFPLLVRAKELSIDGRPLEPWLKYLRLGNDSTLKIDDWVARPGQLIGAGEPVASLSAFGRPIGAIKSPRNGMVTALPGAEKEHGIPSGPLFSVKHFESDEEKRDPFEDIVSFCKKHFAAAKRAVTFYWVKIAIVSAITLAIAYPFANNDIWIGAFIIAAIGAAPVFRWVRKLMKARAVIRRYPDESALSAVRELPPAKDGQRAHPLLSAPANTEPVPPPVISRPAPVEPPMPPAANLQTAQADSQPPSRAQQADQDITPVHGTPVAVESEGETQGRAQAPLRISEDEAEVPPIEPPSSVSGIAVRRDAVRPAAIPAAVPIVEPPTPSAANIETDPALPFYPSAIAASRNRSEKPAISGQEKPEGQVQEEQAVEEYPQPPSPLQWPDQDITPVHGTPVAVESEAVARADAAAVRTAPIKPKGSEKDQVRPLVLVAAFVVAVVLSLVVAAFMEHSGSIARVPGEKKSLQAISEPTPVKSQPRAETLRVKIEIVRTIWGASGLGLDFSPDGRVLAFGGNSLMLWDIAGDKAICKLTVHPQSLAFSHDGSLLASVDSNHSIKLWDPARCRELRAISGFQGGALSVAFSPDSTLLAVGGRDGNIGLWDVRSGSVLKKIPAGQDVLVDKVVFSPDGRMLASNSGGSLKLWEVATGTELHKMSWASKYYASVAFSPDARLVAAGAGSEIRLWDTATGREVRTFAGHKRMVDSVVFSPDGRLLASSSDDYTIKVWEVATGADLRTLYGHGTWVGDLAFSPDGRLLASSGGDSQVKLWRVSERK